MLKDLFVKRVEMEEKIGNDVRITMIVFRDFLCLEAVWRIGERKILYTDKIFFSEMFSSNLHENDFLDMFVIKCKRSYKDRI